MLSHPVDKYVGQKLKERRIMLGISQGDLGCKVGVTFQQIQKYERGFNRIGCSRLYEISQVLDVTVSYFFDKIDAKNTLKKDRRNFEDKCFIASENENESLLENEESSSKEVLTLIKAYSKIKDAKTRKNIISLVRSIAKLSSEENDQ